MGKNKVLKGRFTADRKEPFVVFIIGFRINRFTAFSKWVPTAKAMGPMIRELYQHPELGFWDREMTFHLRGITLTQYWRSYADLLQYSRGGLHLKAWKRFNQTIGSDGTVGIFHESYIVKPDQYECVYANMPKTGLAKGTQHIPAEGNRRTAKKRLKVHS